MTTTKLDLFSSATAMLQALRERQLSAVELLDLHLRRIERFNPTLNAIVIPDYDNARKVAEAADAARARGEDGPLLGLPLTIKDCIDVEGLLGTAGVEQFASASRNRTRGWWRTCARRALSLWARPTFRQTRETGSPLIRSLAGLTTPGT